jgi:cell wall-associated NlpC family hydrolase
MPFLSFFRSKKESGDEIAELIYVFPSTDEETSDGLFIESEAPAFEQQETVMAQFDESVETAEWMHELPAPVVVPRPSLSHRLYRQVLRRRAAISLARRRQVRRVQSVGRALVAAVDFVLSLPGRFWRGLLNAPAALFHAWMALPWDRWLTIRRGFLVGLMIGLSVAGSTLYALSSLPHLPGRPIEPMMHPTSGLNAARLSVPTELAWFFIQFPYVSESATIRSKNRHTFVVSDSARKREYVIQFGQRYRRVEIYSEDRLTSQTQIFTPGTKRTVQFQGNKIAGQSTQSDPNLWMWRTPLWNATQLKIFGLADLWLNSPYKRYSCAGFVHRFLKDAGVKVPILDAWDLAKQPWTRIPLEEIEPGDIITIEAASPEHRRFWRHRVTHVGVYIGHGKLIHASTPSRKAARSWIKIADVDDFRRRIDKILRPPELL